MSEIYPSDTLINALSGTKDSQQEVQYPAIYESPYYTTFYKMLYRLLDVARRAGDLRVYKDGDLTFGVRAGKFSDGTTSIDYSGAAAVALTNNATNSIYIESDGTLKVVTTGFPSVAATPHLPLAQIVAADGSYDFDDITDMRGRGLYSLVTSLSSSQANELCDGSNADSLHTHGGNGIDADSIGFSHLDSTFSDRIPEVSMAAVDNADGTATITIQLVDAQSNNLLKNMLVRIWTTSTSDLLPGLEATLSIVDGCLLETVQSNVDIQIITNSNGVINITASSASTTIFTCACSFGGIIKTIPVSITVS